MKTVISGLVVIALAVTSTVATSQSASRAAQAPAAGKAAPGDDYYPLKVGNKWHYELDNGNGQKVQLVSQIGGLDKVGDAQLARLEVVANGQKLPATEHLQRKDDGVYRVRMNNVDVSPPICLIKFPTKADQKWGGETTAGGQKMNVDCTEGASEKVKVPAGEFDAIPTKIVVTAGANKFTNIFWFAKGTGIVKQKSEIGPLTVTMELTKFEPAQ